MFTYKELSMSNANESSQDTRNTDLFDPDDPEYQKQLWRPPDIEQDVKEMERRKRVEIIMNSLSEEFDNVLLISLVQARPVLWNNYSEMAKSQHAIRSAWNEVCSSLVGEFETLSEPTRNALRLAVTRRWNNIKNAYAKYQKKFQKWKRTGEGPKVKPYAYHEQLQFLSKQYESKGRSRNTDSTSGLFSGETSDSMDRNWEDGASENEELVMPKMTSTRPMQPSASRKRLKPVEPESPSTIQNRAFFEAMKPHINSFDATEMLEFQMGVMQLIRNINDRKKRGPPAPCYPQYHMHPNAHNNSHYIPTAPAPTTYNQFMGSASSNVS